MEPFVAIPADFEPQNVLELGRDRAGAAWSAPPISPGAQLVHLAERHRWVRKPADLASELASFDSPLDLVIDHGTDDASASVSVFEVVFGRVRPGGLYVIDAVLPSAIVLDLMLATVASPGLLESVALVDDLVVVRRGPEDQSFEPLRLADLTSDPFSIIR